MRWFYIHDREMVTSELDGQVPNLKWTVERINDLVGHLYVIRTRYIYDNSSTRLPRFAVVASNLMDAIVADRALRTAPAVVPGGGDAGGDTGATIDTSLQPIAASTLPSASGHRSVGIRSQGLSISNRMLGVARTGSYDASRRPGLRIPGVTLSSTSDSDREARSRGAEGVLPADRATGAKPVPPPTQVKPATPASPPTVN